VPVNCGSPGPQSELALAVAFALAAQLELSTEEGVVFAVVMARGGKCELCFV
jgi:hypothetical protein